MRVIYGRTAAARWAAALVALGLAAGGCSTASRAPTATRKVVEVLGVQERRHVRPFRGVQLDGASFSSADTVGRVVVYNVWGSWCAPCRTEASALRRVSRATRKLGVLFVGIDVRDNDAAARAFEARYRIDYPSITSDTAASALLAFGPALPPSAVPSTLVVDATGRLAARIVGPTDASTLSSIVAQVTAETETTQ